MSLPTVSLVVPCYNEEAFIHGILMDIENQSYPKDNIELFVVDGRSEDKTRAIFKSSKKEVSYKVKLIDNPDRIAPIAMNLGIEASSGSYVFIWGAHASYPEDFIERMVTLAEHTQADCVGAVCDTRPRNNSIKGFAIAEILRHPLGVGNASFRTGVDEVSEVDTVAFGCYKKDTFDHYGLFNPKLIRNQDIELNKRIVNQGGKILLDPKTRCTYYARSTYRGLWKNNFGNGEWVVNTAKITGQFEALSLRHFIPLIFVVGLCLSVCSTFFNLIFGLLPEWCNLLFISPILLYLLIITGTSANISLKNKKIKILPFAIYSFLILHISYGLGSLKGLFNGKKF
jgi:glycosyltransferase involved in cell wall biosynthesis